MEAAAPVALALMLADCAGQKPLAKLSWRVDMNLPFLRHNFEHRFS
jgi:hypothetical protein